MCPGLPTRPRFKASSFTRPNSRASCLGGGVRGPFAMDLKSGYPYWTVKNGLLASFPPLARDVRCDVAGVGAGITGALIARSLCEAGLDVVVLDKRDAGWGSTAATTALLQYEIDGGMLDIA